MATTNVVVVNVNHAPVADAGPNVSVVEGTQVSLSAANSYDPDIDALTYTWTQISGPSVALSSTTSSTPSFAAPIIGGAVNSSVDLIFAVTASDGALSNASHVTVRVDRTNHAPTASAGPNMTVNSTSVVTISGSGIDPDNDPLQATWVQTVGPTVVLTNAGSFTPSFTAPPTSAPLQLFNLIATDGALASAPSSVTVTVVSLWVCDCRSTYADRSWQDAHSFARVGKIDR